uniref:SPFH domain-containing protein n=1 Tax=Prevotella heparinolytica TaxID=28113 RepID=UPI0035A196F1
METKELDFNGFKMNGFVALFLHLVVFSAIIVFGFIIGVGRSVPLMFFSMILLVLWFILFAGYMELEPNEARAMVFFGKYKGTFKETGFFLVNPFLNKKKLSLRARNLDVEPIKVNDKIGNPILIGLVLVWKLKDTYKAMFEIDSQTMANRQASAGYAVAGRMNAFENFVKIQSDAALRQVA